MVGTNSPKLWLVRVPNHEPEYYLVDDSNPANAKRKVMLAAKTSQVDDPVEPLRI